jgi:hypothetical protein
VNLNSVANLRPDKVAPYRWKPGQSGNPSGRRKIPDDVREAARSFTAEAIATLGTIMRDKKAPPAARVRCAEVLLDRGWGRPETSATIRVSREVRDLSTAEILVALSALGIAGENGEAAELRITYDPPLDEPRDVTSAERSHEHG